MPLKLNSWLSVVPQASIRQSKWKSQFVDCLVESATQMVEVIWPLSVSSCCSESCHGVLPLRTFIQEILRRSYTSFSTLQVALYYLILIKPHVTHYGFTIEQSMDRLWSRTLQCGRRMFLAALILASKYLQDRNYSARAWSEISGWTVHEINISEMAFLQAVDWRLHVPEPLFERWQDILIKYTDQQPTSSALVSVWRSIVPCITPELDMFGSDKSFKLRAQQPVWDYISSNPGIVSSPIGVGPPRVLEHDAVANTISAPQLATHPTRAQRRSRTSPPGCSHANQWPLLSTLEVIPSINNEQ